MLVNFASLALPLLALSSLTLAHPGSNAFAVQKRSGALALARYIDPNPAPQHHPRYTTAPLDSTTQTRKDALELFTQVGKLADDLWEDKERVERLAERLAAAPGEEAMLSREIHATLFNLTRTIKLSAGQASRTRVAIHKPSASALAPLRVKGKTRTRLGTTSDEVAEQLTRVLSTAHATLHSLTPIRTLLVDSESIYATAEELDWELRSMLEGAEMRLEAVTVLTAARTRRMRLDFPGKEDDPLSLHLVFHALHLAEVAAGVPA